MSGVFDPNERRVARCIEGDHPQWCVIWGVYSRIYSAFPLFDGPPGTIITARDAGELIALMRAAEEDALVPSYEEEPEWPAYEEEPARPEPAWPEPGWPAPGDPESWPSGELAFLPSGPDIGGPEKGEAAAGAVAWGRGFRRYRAARRGQW